MLRSPDEPAILSRLIPAAGAAFPVTGQVDNYVRRLRAAHALT